MYNSDNMFTIFHDESSVFADHSFDLEDYCKDNVSLTLQSGDYVYVGLYKPFDCLYVELNTPSTVMNSGTVEKFDGSNWVNAGYRDDTKGMVRSGYISFDKTNMMQTTVNGKELYFIRYSVDMSTTAMVVSGINVVFSDDGCLKSEAAEVIDDCLYVGGFNSHIVTHVAARNHILQDLANCGFLKGSCENPQGYTQFDLLNIQEVKQAACYLALAKIFIRMADSQDSIWFVKYQEYQGKYEETMKQVRLTLDSDDDGAADENEIKGFKRIMRWSR